MSLKVWLPLNGDLRNLGSSDVTVAGGVIDTNGKIGKCYLVNKTNKMTITHNLVTTTEWSMSWWMNCPSSMNDATAWESMFVIPDINADTGANSSSSISWTSYHNIKIWDDTNHQWKWAAPGTDFNYDKWHLWTLAHTANGAGVQGKIYIDGVLKGTYNNTTHPLKIRAGTITIANEISTGGFYINDFRLYDHCLSALEVKELSYGLVCHYKFDNIYNMNNLILNGNGELGAKHWSSSTNISTTEIPPNQPIIKASFYSDNMTADYIEINKYSVYTISAYLKTTGGTTGTFYPSIYPYDYDKKFIQYHNCPDGFGSAYRTTLAQPLKKGDTIIHATDLSAWTTAENYYYHVAIFGYRDSTGYIYPDMQYTADSPIFGTRTDKSHINKDNNTITLNSAFTGEDRPAGTTICQATEGAAYYYPFGGIAESSVQDWTLKTATLRPSTINRLRWAKYIKWRAFSGAYYAGNKLMDMTWWDNYIKDDSGNGYNLEIVNNLLADSDTPRYSYSTRFPLNTSYCRVTFPSVSGFANSYTFSWWGKSTSTGTMMWGFSNGNRLNLYLINPVCWNTGDSGNNPFAGISPITDNKFHYYTITGDGTTTKLYIDGDFKANAKTYKAITGTTLYFNGWDTSTSYKFCGCLSDFKLFATALSADDIKRIYEEAIAFSKNATGVGYEVVENGSRELLATRITATYEANDSYYTKLNSQGEIQFDGAVQSCGSPYIMINPSGKTYYYDYTISVATGNQFYIGFERYDKDKTATSNQSCVYTLATKPSADIVKQRYRGTVNLSTDAGGRACRYIRLRVLSGWAGTDSSSTKTATVHSLSLREITTSEGFDKLDIQKTGVFDIDTLQEYFDTTTQFEKTGMNNMREFIEK